MYEIDAPPTAAALMESTRSIGYSFDSAVADIIDNSISAGATHVWIRSVPSDDPYVAILDDGAGMGAHSLAEAMRYGTNPNMQRSETDLGRFGLGMKMASLSQCRMLTVVSKCEGEVNACRWNLDRVIQTDQWTLQIPSMDDINILPLIDSLTDLNSGTLVVWQNLDKLKERSMNIEESMADAIRSFRSHISLVFHRFLDTSYGGSLSIEVNGTTVEPLDPFLSKNTKVSRLPEQNVIIQGQAITIKPFVLPPESSLSRRDIALMGGAQRKLQGFWVYRNRRLIIPGTWFRLTGNKELTKLARVMVDIPNTLDSIWDIDVKKSTATVPAPFRKEFESVLGRILDKSEGKYRFRGRRVGDLSKNFIWNKYQTEKEVSYSLNLDHPMVKQVLDGLDDVQRTDVIRLMRLIEESVPFHDIYCTLADNGSSLKKSNDMSDNLEEIIDQGISLMEHGVPLSILRMTEPFMGNHKVMEALERYDRS